MYKQIANTVIFREDRNYDRVWNVLIHLTGNNSVSLSVELLQGLSQMELFATWWAGNWSKGQLAVRLKSLVASEDKKPNHFTVWVCCTLVFVYRPSPPLGSGAPCLSCSLICPLTWDSARRIEVLGTYLVKPSESQNTRWPQIQSGSSFSWWGTLKFWAQLINFRGCR